MSLESLLLKLSLILLLIMVSFLSASSISLDNVMNSKSEELDETADEDDDDNDDEAGTDLPPPLGVDNDIDEEGIEPYEPVAKLLHNLLKATSFESISFSR
jgi:hypothetical protein